MYLDMPYFAFMIYQIIKRLKFGLAQVNTETILNFNYVLQ